MAVVAKQGEIMTYALRLAIFKNFLAFAHASALADMRRLEQVKSTVATADDDRSAGYAAKE
jgi:hypothetical protein